MMSPIRIIDDTNATVLLKRLSKALGICGLAMMLCLPAYAAMADSWPSGCQWQRYMLACFGNFHDGLARVPTGEIGHGQPIFGYIDKQGRMAIKPQFTGAADFAHGLAKVREDDKWGYIDTDGKWVLKPQYDDASDFGTGGAAMVKKNDIWHLIDRSGNNLHTFVPGTWYSAPDIQSEIDYFPVRLPPRAPDIWSVASGKTVPLPDNVMDVSIQADLPGAVFVQVRGAGNRGRWGLWDKRGEWIVAPKTLVADRVPQSDGQLILVRRSDAWHLFNRQGQSLGTRDYKMIKMLFPGTWYADTADGRKALFGDDGKVLVTFESNHPYLMKTIGPNLVVLPGEDELLMVRPHGKVKHIATPEYSRIEEGNGRIWLYDENRKVVLIMDQNGRAILDTSRFPKLDKVESGRGLLWLYDDKSNLIQLLDHDGKPLLDDDVLAQVRQYSVFAIHPADSYVPDEVHKLPLARLTDYEQHKQAVLTASGHIVSQPEWIDFPKTHDVMPPLLVQTKQGRYGAIDGEGNWVAKPEYKRIITFNGQYTFAWLAGNNHGVILDADGQQHKIRPSIFRQARGIRGHFVLFRKSVEGVGRRMGLWSIPKQQVIMKPVLSDVGTFSDGHFSAQTDLADGGGQAWGLIGPKGKWILPATHQNYSEPEALLPGLFVYEHKVKRHKGRDTTAYQIMSLEKDSAVTPNLKKKPALLGDGRMLIQPLDGGARLIDGRGKTLISLSDDFRHMDSEAHWVTFSFGDRYGAIASDGSWRIKPTRHNSVRAKLPQNDFVVYWSDDHNASGRRAGFKSAATGKPVIGTFFSELEPMREGRAAFRRKRISGDLYGFISKEGRLVVPAAYDAVTSFNDGRALVSTPDGDVYFIDREGNRNVGFSNHCGWIYVVDAKGDTTWADPAAPASCDGGNSSDEQGSAQ